MRAFGKKLLTAQTGLLFQLRVWLKKTTPLMHVTDFLMGAALRPFGATDLRVMRLLYCLELTKQSTHPVAECGIGSGYSMVFILSYLKRAHDQRRYYGFDTFEGFPYISSADLEGLPEERRSVTVVGRYRQFHLNHIKRVARSTGNHNAEFHKGLFGQTIPALPAEIKFSFVYMDCDLYESYKSCLEAIYPRLAPGGLILFDEYEHVIDWPGARRAINEFFADKVEKPQPLPFGESWFVQKHDAECAKDMIASEPWTNQSSS